MLVTCTSREQSGLRETPSLIDRSKSVNQTIQLEKNSIRFHCIPYRWLLLLHLVVVAFLFPSPLRSLVTRKRWEAHVIQNCLKKSMVHSSSQALNKPISVQSHSQTLRNTFTPALLRACLLLQLSPPLSYPHPTHPSPPLPRFSWAHSLLVRSICSRAVGILLCQEYSLLHCTACHLEANNRGETELVLEESCAYHMSVFL